MPLRHQERNNPNKMNDEPEFLSSCCGAASAHMEYGICPECKDHCEFTKVDEDGDTIETYEP